LTPFTQSLRPFPQFVDTTLDVANGKSKYDALLLEAKRRLGHFSFDANYVYANSMANYLDTENVYSLLHWNHDQYTARSRMVIQFLYDLPLGRGQRWGGGMSGPENAVVGGWHVNWFSTFQSGQFYTPSYSGSDPSNTDIFGGIPDRIGNGNLSRAQRSPNHYFDPTAFAVPQPGHFGDSGVDILEGPRYNICNMTLGKEFRITERVRANLEALFQDMFNTPAYEYPAANISSKGTVGVISAALGGLSTGGTELVETGGQREIVLRFRLDF
jgi:hypothetical protein